MGWPERARSTLCHPTGTELERSLGFAKLYFTGEGDDSFEDGSHSVWIETGFGGPIGTRSKEESFAIRVDDSATNSGLSPLSPSNEIGTPMEELYDLAIDLIDTFPGFGKLRRMEGCND